MYIEDKGIVLKCVKYDDKSFIAHLFTAHHGHLSFIVSGGRSKRSSMNARLFAPLSFVTFQCDLKPNTTLQRIKEAHALFVQQDTPYHPVKRSMAMLLGEFMAYALREETENKDLYTYLEHSFRWLDIVDSGFANFHLVFLVKLAKFIGIAPNIDAYGEGNSFDLTRGRFIEHGITCDTVMSERDASVLYRLHLTNYETMGEIAMNRQDRARMIDYMATYYAIHLPKFPALQSLEILQQLFD